MILFENRHDVDNDDEDDLEATAACSGGGNLGSEGARGRERGRLIPSQPTHQPGGGGRLMLVKDKRGWLIPGYFVKSQTNHQTLSRGPATL